MAVSATCGNLMLYMLPMMLGRTFDRQSSTVGIDIFSQADIDKAIDKAQQRPTFASEYLVAEKISDRRKFLGISGDLGIKISAGLVDVKGAGEYMKDVAKMEKTVEILVKTKFTTVEQEIDPDAETLQYWKTMDKKTVGTHVVTSLQYGGEMYASVKFVAYKDSDLQEIKVQVDLALQKGGAFDLNATGKFENLSKNLSSRAKMEIDYYATAPVSKVPTSIADLKLLVSEFKENVIKINNGNGVAICAGWTPLSKYQSEYQFYINQALQDAFDRFNDRFDNLNEAKAILKSLIKSMPENVPQDYLNKVIDFSNRLTSTLMTFHRVVGEMDLQKGSEQLEPALTAFDTNSKSIGTFRYTTEIKKLRRQMEEKEDPQKPRGTYVRWGKRSCGPKASSILYIGFMSSFTEEGTGSGTEYQCLPENPDMNLDLDITGETGSQSILTAVRYRSLSVFQQQGRKVEDKVASCVVCESYMRPTVSMFPAAITCPGDWVEEYTGFIVSSNHSRAKSEYVCLDTDPDFYDSSAETGHYDPVILPIKMGSEGLDGNLYSKDASLPCVVCSK